MSSNNIRFCLITVGLIALATPVLAQGAGSGAGGAGSGAASSGNSSGITAAPVGSSSSATGGTEDRAGANLNKTSPANTARIVEDEKAKAVQGSKTAPAAPGEIGTVSAPGVGVGHSANGLPIGAPGSGLGSPGNTVGSTKQ